ncbi:MAG: hypothetical protein HY437_01730 [Candidatus Magasanikbacteria bacterium]|nr:hypothetical protein [Candidatus Magasanikbacteria bacterium]
MSETKKIGIACAIGGAIGTAVALMVTVAFWWLGLLAGFCAGYVSYEFRAVFRAISQAWRVAIAGTEEGVATAWMVLKYIPDFFTLNHPLLHFVILAGVGGWFSVSPEEPAAFSVKMLFALLVAPSLFFASFTIGLVMSGHVEHKPGECRRCDSLFEKVGMDVDVSILDVYEARTPLMSYVYIFWWSLMPFGYTLLYLFVRIPRWVAVALYRSVPVLVGILAWMSMRAVRISHVCLRSVFLTMPKTVARFTYRFVSVLIHLIHSDKRLLCGVDAAIGTGCAYVTLARPEMTAAQYALIIVAGAMIGAAFGILNWEIVSKRILRVAEQEVPRS